MNSRDPQDPSVFEVPTIASQSGVEVDSAIGVSTGLRSQRSQPYRSSSPPGLGLQSLVEIPFIHKRSIIGCMVLSLLVGWFALLVWPRRYESEAKLMIRVGRESVALDPTATTSETLMLQKTQEEEIISALEILGSRRVAEEVVDQIGATAVLDGYLPSGDTGNQSSMVQQATRWAKDRAGDALHYVLIYTGVRDEISDSELAVRTVQNDVDIYAPKKSSVITIHAESRSAAMARAIAEGLTDSFLDQHLLVSKTKGSQTFFSTQSESSESQLNELIDHRKQFMQENKIVSIEANRQLLQQQLAAIDRDLILATAELEGAGAEIRDLQGKVDVAEDEIIASRQALSDGTWSGMRQRIYELELQEASYASKYTDKHQLLRETRQQLAEARLILAKLNSERVNESTTPNPVKRRMQEDLQRLQTKVVGLQSAIKEKQEQRRQTVLEVNQLHSHEMMLAQMDRDIGVLESNLSLMQQKREEARVIDELQSERISNVSVFQPASLVERPVSPKKKILAAAFVMLGVCGGIGLAFLKEYSSSTMRTVEHVESHLHYPVLSTIPHLGHLRLFGPQTASQEELRHQCRAILSDVLISSARLRSAPARGRTLGVLGIDNGCGASTLASLLALTSSENCGMKTTLIDADMQNRSVSKTFGLLDLPGLVELVRGEADTEDCVQQMEQSDLELIPCSAPASVRRLDADPRDIVDTLRRFQSGSDLVIIDLPSATHPDQAVSLAQHLDHVIVVVQSQLTSVPHAERILRRLGDSNTDVVGIVLNKTQEYLPQWIRKYFGR